MTYTEALTILKQGFPTQDILEANKKSLEALEILADEERGPFRMKWGLRRRKTATKDI